MENLYYYLGIAIMFIVLLLLKSKFGTKSASKGDTLFIIGENNSGFLKNNYFKRKNFFNILFKQ
jgi:hypothetical protein